MYIGVIYEGPRSTDYNYPDPDLALFDDERVTDRNDPNYKANGISFMRNDQGADKQFEYFVPNYSQGLTSAGLARINQSIEAYCYCILSAQARTRSTIHCVSGGAIETQREFLDRIEDSIVLKNISDSIQRYQEAIADTKTRLDFAVAQGVWLMPSHMVINTESIIGYNNMLVIADETMKLCINNDVNQGTHKALLKLMAGGPSKINPPNSHPSNPIHKQATEVQELAKPVNPVKHVKDKIGPGPGDPPTDSHGVDPVKHAKDLIGPGPGDPPDKDDLHHVNKALVAVGALALVGFVIWAKTK